MHKYALNLTADDSKWPKIFTKEFFVLLVPVVRKSKQIYLYMNYTGTCITNKNFILCRSESASDQASVDIFAVLTGPLSWTPGPWRPSSETSIVLFKISILNPQNAKIFYEVLCYRAYFSFIYRWARNYVPDKALVKIWILLNHCCSIECLFSF